jgi:predicted SAM-dependent methyltransferase
MKKVLHVGCGQKTIMQMPVGFQDGTWSEVRFDINESVRPDIIGTITEMSTVEDASVNALYSSHNIEHVFPHEVVSVLSEFRRVIKAP